jgi:hypothetical protein
LVNKLTGRVIEALGQGAIADLGTHWRSDNDAAFLEPIFIFEAIENW